MKICNFCLNQVENFLPYKNGSASVSEFVKKINPVGSDVDFFSCPYCGCTDRDRHLKMYIEASGIMSPLKRPRILHFAPEPVLINYFKQFSPKIHILADLHPKDGRFECIDIEDIPYDDSSFDIVIANHIMEHVSSPEKALKELDRIISPNGFVIIQTPFSSLLSKTFSDSGINTPEARDYFYGQDDHVRLFGRDIFELFERYLNSEMKNHKELLGDDLENIYGVNIKEPFFCYRKKSNNQINLRPRAKIVNFDTTLPLISIACITYNHEEFISNALDSFLEQETEFPFEIVIGDDCSFDKTSQIIQSYKDKFPTLINYTRTHSNIGANENLISTMRKCKGQFIAYCEGDDYWTDKFKLQKQATYLLQNPNCVITYGNVQGMIGQDIDYDYIGGVKKDLKSEELCCAPGINTLTVMFRNVIPHFPPEFMTCVAGDMFLWSMLAHSGSGHYLKSLLPSVYRKHPAGLFSLKSTEEKIKIQVMTHYSLHLYYERIEQQKISDFFTAACRYWIDHLQKSLPSDRVRQLLDDIPEIMEKKAVGYYEFDKNKCKIELFG